MTLYICPLWETCPAGNCRHRQPHEAYGDCQVPAPKCENCRPATDEEIEQDTTTTKRRMR